MTSGKLLFSGGMASSTLVANPSFEMVFLGATADATTLITGGQQDVYGVANAAVISSGGVQNVEAGGVASGGVA